MKAETAELVRVVLRYLIGLAGSYGLISVEMATGLSDPTILATMASIAVAVGTEFWWRIDKRRTKAQEA